MEFQSAVIPDHKCWNAARLVACNQTIIPTEISTLNYLKRQLLITYRIRSYRTNVFAATNCATLRNLKTGCSFLIFELFFSSFHFPPLNATYEAIKLPFKKRLKDRPKPLMHNCGNLVIFEHKRVLESRSEC